MNPRHRLRTMFVRYSKRFPAMEPALKTVLLAAASVVALAVSFELRFDFAPAASEWEIFWRTLPIVVVIRGCANWWWGLHRHWWRFVSLPDLGRILRSTIGGSAVFAVVVVSLPLMGIPRSIILLEAALTFLLSSGMMIFSRQRHPGKASAGAGHGKRVLIVGAGETAINAARELHHHVKLKYVPVAFVDDDPRKQGALLFGVPVLGTIADIPELVSDYGIEEIVIAMPSVKRSRMREIMDVCQRTGLRIGILPATTDLIQGRVTVNRLREVRIEDLLGRPAVALDITAVRPVLEGSTVCITGAGGSIGSELCRQVAICGPDLLVMMDRNENSLHYLQLELAERFPTLALQPVVADVTDLTRVERIIRESRPRVIFHAAAYKHVPLMEANPCEAVMNNVGGTRILAQMAERYGVERFVMISTDKAINPTSVMGASKRVAEILLQGLQRSSRTRFVIVRFGNVLGSEGSVVPIFSRQIARGGPVTVTHPEVVRFFMLVQEAVHLVLHASVIGEPGDLFLLDMGEPVRIMDLAADMIRLSGLEPNVDVEIRVTGLRPGEKLYEELITPGEVAVSTSHPKIMRLNDGNHRNWVSVRARIANLESLAREQAGELVRAMLGEIVPEYQPSTTSFARPAATAEEQPSAAGTPAVLNGPDNGSDRKPREAQVTTRPRIATAARRA